MTSRQMNKDINKVVLKMPLLKTVEKIHKKEKLNINQKEIMKYIFLYEKIISIIIKNKSTYGAAKIAQLVENKEAKFVLIKIIDYIGSYFFNKLRFIKGSQSDDGFEKDSQSDNDSIHGSPKSTASSASLASSVSIVSGSDKIIERTDLEESKMIPYFQIEDRAELCGIPFDLEVTSYESIILRHCRRKMKLKTEEDYIINQENILHLFLLKDRNAINSLIDVDDDDFVPFYSPRLEKLEVIKKPNLEKQSGILSEKDSMQSDVVNAKPSATVIQATPLISSTPSTPDVFHKEKQDEDEPSGCCCFFKKKKIKSIAFFEKRNTVGLRSVAANDHQIVPLVVQHSFHK